MSGAERVQREPERQTSVGRKRNVTIKARELPSLSMSPLACKGLSIMILWQPPRVESWCHRQDSDSPNFTHFSVKLESVRWAERRTALLMDYSLTSALARQITCSRPSAVETAELVTQSEASLAWRRGGVPFQHRDYFRVSIPRRHQLGHPVLHLWSRRREFWCRFLVPVPNQTSVRRRFKWWVRAPVWIMVKRVEFLVSFIRLCSSREVRRLRSKDSFHRDSSAV